MTKVKCTTAAPAAILCLTAAGAAEPRINGYGDPPPPGALMRLDRPYFEQWLDPAEQDADALAGMLRQYRADAMRAYPVSALVNSPKNDDVRCLEPAA